MVANFTNTSFTYKFLIHSLTLKFCSIRIRLHYIFPITLQNTGFVLRAKMSNFNGLLCTDYGNITRSAPLFIIFFGKIHFMMLRTYKYG